MTKKEILQIVDAHYLEVRNKSNHYRELSEQFPDNDHFKLEASSYLTAWYEFYMLMRDLYK